MRVRSSTKRVLVRAFTPAYLLLCLGLGGASAAGLLANLTLQLLALPILVAALLRSETPVSAESRQLLAMALLLVVVMLLQLVPLPPGLWTNLPGRGEVVEGYRLLGQPLPWLPVSLAPQRTLAALLWLLPAFACLVSVARLGLFRSSWIAVTLVGFAIVSVAVGSVQLGSGVGSPAYFYRFTNWGQAVGFFANANHLATALLVTIPFAAAILAGTLDRGRGSQRESAITVVTLATMAVLLVGLAISGSLAGIGLAVPVAGASFLLVWLRKRRLPRWVAPALGVAAVAGLALVFSQPFGNNLTGENVRENSESRYTSFSKSLAAAAKYAPVGSGSGSFLDVYRQGEDPARVTRTFMNHVHSDPIEIWLETGVVGIALMALLLAWWGRRTWAIWRQDQRDVYARAATIASGAIMAHSFVDYPLRTAAISALFAVCLALMAKPRERQVRSRIDRETEARHLVA